MATAKRATIYFEPRLHRAMRRKAAANDTTISEIVNDAVRDALAEDEADLKAFEERRNEPDIAFEDFVRDLKRRGKL
jgi:hypothetical protein